MKLGILACVMVTALAAFASDTGPVIFLGILSVVLMVFYPFCLWIYCNSRNRKPKDKPKSSVRWTDEEIDAPDACWRDKDE